MPVEHKPIPCDIGEFVYVDRGIPHGLRWKKPRSRSVHVDDPAGSLKSHGHYMLRFEYDFYLNHRVIYFLETGVDPGSFQIDHVRHKDNSGPLRLVTHQQNQFNRKSARNSSSKYKGVVRSKDKWLASITKDGKRMPLGRFSSEAEAASAYNEAAIRLFGEHACLNQIASDLQPSQ